MNKLLIYGASYPDIAYLLEDVNTASPTWDIVGVVDDTSEESEFMGYPIVGDHEVLSNKAYRSCAVLNNVFSRPAARAQVAERIRAAGLAPATCVHPSVKTQRADIGAGVVVMEGARIGARAVLGDWVTVRYNAIINHDNVLDEFVFVGPGAVFCGHVQVGRNAYVGAGSVVRERLRIGVGATVGMGSVVVRDVEEGATVWGNPARPKEV